MEKIRVGVFGVGRGDTMVHYCTKADNAVLVAMCDKRERPLLEQKKIVGDDSVACYTSFDEFLEHPMDVMVLANYATEHAPFAMRAMRKGINVISEVLPCQTLKEAVELIETVEETGKKYYFLENYCYLPAVAEMRRLYQAGAIGEFRYGEGEYIHNCESFWAAATYGERNHWRNLMYSTFYCTHSIGPIVHAIGLHPVSVTGFELPYNQMQYRMGCLGAPCGIEMVTFENGGILKSIHHGLYKNSVWYSMYGAKGRMESAREDAEAEGTMRIYVNADAYEGEYPAGKKPESYLPERDLDDKAKGHGHEGSDFYALWNCMEDLRGNPNADVIDVYEAMDMFLPGMFAYFSILDGGKPMEIPDLRKKENRDLYRNDTRCVDPKVAGDMLLPSCRDGNREIPDAIYEQQRKKWLDWLDEVEAEKKAKEQEKAKEE